MTIILRRPVGDVFIIIQRHDDGRIEIEVTTADSRQVSEEARRAAIEEVLREFSEVRQALWRALGN